MTRKKAEPEIVSDWPADNVERRPINDLLPYAGNPRAHPDWQIAQISESMKQWGWTIPILIDEEGNVIAGHGRIFAALRNGYADAPCMIARGWDEEKKRAYVIADNKLALNAVWDVGLLAAELKLLSESSLQMTGFDASELKSLLGISPDAPDQFPTFGEDIDVEHVCPRCGYAFSGGKTQPKDDDDAMAAPDGTEEPAGVAGVQP